MTHDPLDLAYHAAAARGDLAQTGLLERALETESQAPERPVASTAGAAMWYANRGLRVFPIMPGEKRPLPGSHGVKDATCDHVAIGQWFAVHEGRRQYAISQGFGDQIGPLNLGIATGGPYDVLDIDGAEGVVAFAGVLGDGAWLTVCAISQTPRGWHFWVPANPARGNQGAQRSHLDYRGQGGYVVVPPSHINGTVYRWLLPPAA